MRRARVSLRPIRASPATGEPRVPSRPTPRARPGDLRTSTRGSFVRLLRALTFPNEFKKVWERAEPCDRAAAQRADHARTPAHTRLPSTARQYKLG